LTIYDGDKDEEADDDDIKNKEGDNDNDDDKDKKLNKNDNEPKDINDDEASRTTRKLQIALTIVSAAQDMKKS